MKKNTDQCNARQQQQLLYDVHVFHNPRIQEMPGGLRERPVSESKKWYICVTIWDMAETENVTQGGSTGLWSCDHMQGFCRQCRHLVIWCELCDDVDFMTHCWLMVIRVISGLVFIFCRLHGRFGSVVALSLLEFAATSESTLRMILHVTWHSGLVSLWALHLVPGCMLAELEEASTTSRAHSNGQGIHVTGHIYIPDFTVFLQLLLGPLSVMW